MKLTLSSLKQAAATCEGLSADESLKKILDVETFHQISVEGIQLSKTINSLCESIGELENAGESLKKNGFSDEWFDIVNHDGRLEKLIDLDMPKFFKDAQGKQDACQEAISEGIKKFFKALWDYVQKIFKWLWEKLTLVIHWLDQNYGKCDMELKDIKRMIDDVTEESLRAHGMIYDGPCPETTNNYAIALGSWAGAIWAKELEGYFDASVGPNDDVKPHFYAKLADVIEDKRIQSGKEKYGIEINDSKTGVEFANVSDIPKVSTKINSKAEAVKLSGGAGICLRLLRETKTLLKTLVSQSRTTHEFLLKKANTDMQQGAISTTACEYKQAVEQCRLSAAIMVQSARISSVAQNIIKVVYNMLVAMKNS